MSSFLRFSELTRSLTDAARAASSPSGASSSLGVSGGGLGTVWNSPSGDGLGQGAAAAPIVGEYKQRLHGVFFDATAPKVGVTICLEEGVWCGGLIGQVGDRFCTRIDCKVQSHGKRKAKVEMGNVYIKTVKDDELLVAPTVSLGLLGDNPNTVDGTLLTMSEWRCLFESVESDPINNPTDFEARLITLDHARAKSKTPKLNRKVETEDESDWTGADSLGIPVYPFGDMETVNEPSSGSDFLDWLKHSWPAIHQTFFDLKARQEQDSQVSSTAIAVIKAELGERREGTSDLDLWSAVGNLQGGLGDLNASVTKFAGMEPKITDMQPKVNQLIAQLKELHVELPNLLTPALTLVAKVTTPGGRTGDLLDMLSDRVSVLEGGGLNGSGGSRVTIGSQADHLKGLEAEIMMMKATLDRQSEDLALFQSRLGQDQVSIAGHIFQSQKDVENWLRKVDVDFKFAYFYDAVSLLECVVQRVGGDVTTWLLQQHQASRAHYGSELEAHYCLSFKTILPEVFGKVSAGTMHSGVGLPGVKTFTDWDPQNGSEVGARWLITNGITVSEAALKSTISDVSSSSTIENICCKMLDDSIHFVQQFSLFVSEFYIELCNSSTSGKDGNWLVTSQIVRRLFHDLALKRGGGGNLVSMEDRVVRGSWYMWYALQAHRVMKEYLKARFREHPSIAPMLNVHLFKKMVPAEQFKTLSDSLKTMENQVKDAKTVADRAMSLAKGNKVDKKDKA